MIKLQMLSVKHSKIKLQEENVTYIRKFNKLEEENLVILATNNRLRQTIKQLRFSKRQPSANATAFSPSASVGNACRPQMPAPDGWTNDNAGVAS